MTGNSPYEPPRAVEPPPLEPAAGPPTAIKVFGILHLVFGVLGAIGGIWNMVGIFVMKKFIAGTMRGLQDGERLVEAQNAYLDSIAWTSVMGGVFSLVLAVLILVAGAKLLKLRSDALDWSNRYAWASIALKVVSLVVTLLVILPASGRMADSLSAGGGGMPPGLQQTMSMIGALLGGLLSFIYPVLTLVLLNRRPVKAFFDSQR